MGPALLGNLSCPQTAYLPPSHLRASPSQAPGHLDFEGSPATPTFSPRPHPGEGKAEVNIRSLSGRVRFILILKEIKERSSSPWLHLPVSQGEMARGHVPPGVQEETNILIFQIYTLKKLDIIICFQCQNELIILGQTM